MRARAALGAGTAVAVVAISAMTGCTRPNPAYDDMVAEPWVGEDTEGGTTGSVDGGLDGPADPDGVDSGEDGGAGTDGGPSHDDGDDDGDGADGDGGDGDDGSGDEDEGEGDDRLLYSSLDGLAAVVSPEVGAGVGLLSEPPPEVAPGLHGEGLRTSTRDQWFAFPQRAGNQVNVDHAAGTLAFDVRIEVCPPHDEPRELVNLAGVLPAGGGIRLGIAGASDGNRLRVEYLDAAGQPHLTRYPAGLLPIDAWAHVELAWRADVEPGEPNVRLWIDDELIEPLEGYAAGPLVAGPAPAADVMIFGSWSLGSSLPAQATFDEIELRGD